jgi:hypothetical protein
MSKDGFSVDAAISKGRELPDWYMDGPDLLPGDEFYLRAFGELSTCRYIGMSAGPIPWTAMVTYGKMVGLDTDAMELFILVLRMMDSEYLEYQNSQIDKPPPQKRMVKKPHGR